MVDNEAWLELGEVSTEILDIIHSSPSDSNVVHLSLSSPTSRKTAGKTRQHELTSVVLEAVSSPTSQNDSIHVHPLLYEFLAYSAHARLKYDSSDVSTELDETTDKDNVHVKIHPLPIESIEELDMETEAANHLWELRPMKVTLWPTDIEIHLSCVYIDPDVMADCTTGDDQMSVDRLNALLSMGMQGRLIMANTVTVLNTSSGVAIVLVRKVAKSSRNGVDETRVEDSMLDHVLRLGAASSYCLHIDGIHQPPSLSMGSTMQQWEQDVPGYESLQAELLRMIQLNVGIGCTASPSGILLTGCAGVGKTRLASTIAHHISVNQKVNTVSGSIHWVSAQELLFLASTEADLAEKLVLPKPDCVLWVIEDLSILERDFQDGEDMESGSHAQDTEYNLVLNAILQAIDHIVRRNDEKDDWSCNIIGIGYDAARLPRELTKINRLEKEVTMLPPTQWQRAAIWESLLHGDLASLEQIKKWSNALSTATTGCVVGDLVRIYQDARTRAWARQTYDSNTVTVMDSHEHKVSLHWRDLSEAAWACTPSQLAELDVTRPELPEESTSMSWEEIHNRCWSKFGGYNATKKRAFLHIVTPWRRLLRSLEKVVQDGAETSRSTTTFEIEPPAGVLFHGPSGCGKTMAARCLAASLHLPIIQVRATDVLDKWLGGSEAFLRSLFSRARAASPCILFLDEVDAIANNRSDDDNELASRVLSTLLNELDGVSTGARLCRVLVVACTNRLDALDAALLRPGRLEEHLHLDLPSITDLSEILHLFVQSMPLDESVDLEGLARDLFNRGATGADVEGICRDVCLMGMRTITDDLDRLSLSQQDFIHAIETI